MKFKFILCILLLGFLTITSYSTEDGHFESCESSYSLFYDSAFDKLIVCCMGWPGSVNIVDPSTGIVLDQVSINGYPESAFSINNGNNLLVLTSEADQNRETKDSLLSSINISTGQVDAQVAIDDWSTDMVIDNTETYAYVASGLNFGTYNNNNKLIKYSLPDLTYILDINFIAECEDIEISNDGTKLYAHNGNNDSIVILNTVDLSITGTELDITHRDFYIQKGFDDRIFASVAGPIWGETDPALYVIDTSLDQIVHTIDLGEIGIESTAINPITRKLYGLTYTPTYLMPFSNDLFYGASNMIIEMNLDDYTYNFITLGVDPLWEIAVAHGNGMNRLFCRVVESNIIRYKDM